MPYGELEPVNGLTLPAEYIGGYLIALEWVGIVGLKTGEARIAPVPERLPTAWTPEKIKATIDARLKVQTWATEGSGERVGEFVQATMAQMDELTGGDKPNARE